MEKCKELFIDDIVGITVHTVSGCRFPIPNIVQGITSMSNCVLSTPVLAIGNGDSMISPVDGSMTAKCSQDIQATGMVFNIEVSVNIEDDVETLREAYINIGNNDHFVCLQKNDGSLYLCYTLPNTFSFKAPSTIKGSQTAALSFTLKAYSEFISISIV